MNSIEQQEVIGADQGRVSRLGGWWVVLPILIYVLLRLPTLVHSPGVQDEQWFAVPGWTVWNEGVPRIPYLPTRNRETFFENADRCLMTLPPGLFYLQAPFHAIFPPGYPTARIPLFLGALATIVITFGVARILGASHASALLAATLMAACRPLLFTGLTARPELLSAVCGWICILLLWRFFRQPKRSTLVSSGFVCGLAGLFHPFAMVFAMQSGAAILLSASTVRQKMIHLLLFGIACAVAIGFWAPLIWMYPDEFRSQFFSNVVDRAGPGLPSRLMWPWPSLQHHAWLLSEFAGLWQCGFFSIAILSGSIAVYRSHQRRFAVGYLALCWSSVFLTAVVAGDHPTKGYWIYPCVWILGAFAISIDRWIFGYTGALSNEHQRTKSSGRIAFAVITSLALGSMVPGGGLRTTSLYWQRWGDPELHAPTFIRNALSELPSEGLYLADLSYVYDVYLSGRETRLCQERLAYWGDQQIDYDAILLAWEGDDANWASQYDAVREKRFGSRELPQICFLDLYRPREPVDE